MPVTASPVVSQPSADAAGVAQASGTAPADLQPVPQAIERLSKDGQALPRAAEKASADLARVPESAIRTLPKELVPLEAYVEANLPIAKAMPLVDIVYGGGVLVVLRCIAGQEAERKRKKWPGNGGVPLPGHHYKRLT